MNEANILSNNIEKSQLEYNKIENEYNKTKQSNELLEITNKNNSEKILELKNLIENIEEK